MISVMGTRDMDENRKNGIYYTPRQLAEFLVRPLIQSSHQTIFDPAYGDGALLAAAEKILKGKTGTKNPANKIFGCDKNPINGRLGHLPPSNLFKMDFFDYPFAHSYDVILMNPPYVRHYLIGSDNRAKYRHLTSSLCRLNMRSDLWAYFLIKAIGHLKESGSIGAILPWSFLQADYAQPIRKWLLDQFEEIRILALSTEYFDKTEERVLLVWLKNYGNKTHSIEIFFSKKISDHIDYYGLNQDVWQSSTVMGRRAQDIETVIERYIAECRFRRFEEVADVRIGVVTGADDFFIMPKAEARRKCLRKEQLLPILTSSKEFSGLVLNGEKELKQLVLFSDKKDEYETAYIKEGESKKCHLTAYSRLRTPWYNVKIGRIPNAFFPYRISNIPYLMFNNQAQAQCTNSIHRIYFKNLSEIEKRWAQVSLLSMPGQLSIERYARTYGRRMLKIEPGSLKKAIVYLSDSPDIDDVYDKISSRISLNDKYGAVDIATRFIHEKLKVAHDLSAAAQSIYHDIQSQRLA